jgi:hypothetical protein
MPSMSCQSVPRACRALSLLRASFASTRVVFLSGVLLLGSCEEGPVSAANSFQGSTAPEPSSKPCRGAGCPAICPDILCVDSAFGISFERADPWPLGAYYFRVRINRGQPRVCKVEFEPVIGAVVDTCNDADFGIGYLYVTEQPLLFGLGFSRSVRYVDVELLAAEEGPPLAEVHSEAVYVTGTLGEPPCAQSCTKGEVLVVVVDGQATSSIGESAADGGFAAQRDAGP